MPRRLAPALVNALYDLLYRRLAWTYDAVAWAVSLGQWRAWGAAGLPYLVGPRVLELGHGPGHLLVELATRGYAVTGLDLSPQMGHLARRRGRKLRLVRGRAQALPFAAGAFDSALATFPTPYVTAPATVAAIYRVLRPGGRLVVVPEARLLGGGALPAAIEALYRLTGQRGAAGDPAARLGFWQSALSGPGFRVSVHEARLVDSIVTIVVAERPASG